MKSLYIFFIFICLAAGTAFAQQINWQFEGSYQAYYEENSIQKVMMLTIQPTASAAYTGELVQAEVNGLNEVRTTVSQMNVDNTNHTIAFEAFGKSWSGTMTTSCDKKTLIIQMKQGSQMYLFKKVNAM